MKRAVLAIFLSLAATAPSPAQTQPAPLVAFAKAWAGMSGYHTTAHIYQVDGAQTQNSVYDYSFTKPSTISMNIRSGPNAGTSASWTGGTSVRTGHDVVSLTDPSITAIRGTTLVALSFGAILRHAQETAGKLTTSATSLNGAPVDLVNIDVANPHGDDGLTREVLYLSQATNLPVRLDGFIGDQLVQTVGFENTTTH